MIIEEEQKIEIVDDPTKTKKSEKKPKKEKIENLEKKPKKENTENSEKKEQPEQPEQQVKQEQQDKFKQIPNNSENTSKHWIIAICIFLISFLILIIIIFGGFTIYNYSKTETISHGIYINNIDVSNLTKDEAKEKLNNYYNERTSNDITLIYGDFTTYIKTSEINLEFNIDSAVNYAYQCGKTNNIFSDNYQIFNAMINGINIIPTITYDKEALSNLLNNLSKELPDAVVESGYYIEGNNLIITKGTDGVVIDVDATTKNIESKLSNLNYVNEIIELVTVSKAPDEININKIYNEVHKEAKDASFEPSTHKITSAENGIDFNVDEAQKLLDSSDNECTIPLKILKPNVTNNMISGDAFPDLLATYSTKYAASNKNRTTNLRLAAEKINGTVLLPGEIFSYNNVVGERTISAGYKDAAIYLNGQVVDGLGGGICQISTTLFNAVLFSNLEIVELYNHQFIPSYATAGRDATVVYGVKDFKFKNSRNYAIKINCSVSNGVASFQIWGYKQEPEYEVSVSANVTSRTSSYIKSVTYRTLRLNGEIVKTEKISNYTYKVH